MSILKQAEAGTPIQTLHEHRYELCYILQVEVQIWRHGSSMMTRLKELEAENARLKRMYTDDERLKSDILQDALLKKLLRPLQRKLTCFSKLLEQFKIFNQHQPV